MQSFHLLRIWRRKLVPSPHHRGKRGSAAQTQCYHPKKIAAAAPPSGRNFRDDAFRWKPGDRRREDQGLFLLPPGCGRGAEQAGRDVAKVPVGRDVMRQAGGFGLTPRES